jgi:hypothetical protein
VKPYLFHIKGKHPATLQLKDGVVIITQLDKKGNPTAQVLLEGPLPLLKQTFNQAIESADPPEKQLWRAIDSGSFKTRMQTNPFPLEYFDVKHVTRSDLGFRAPIALALQKKMIGCWPKEAITPQLLTTELYDRPVWEHFLRTGNIGYIPPAAALHIYPVIVEHIKTIKKKPGLAHLGYQTPKEKKEVENWITAVAQTRLRQKPA